MTCALSPHSHGWRLAAAAPIAVALATFASAQAPEILSYDFDAGDATNSAIPGSGFALGVATDVMFGPAATCSGTGQAATSIAATTGIDSGWQVDFGMSDWTVGMILDVTGGGNAFQYVFGSASAAGYRCFANGVAGVDNLMLRTTSQDIIATGAAVPGAPHHVAFVYDSTVPEVRAYVDGSLVATSLQSGPLNINGSAADFQVMRYTSAMLPGNTMDEFRVYRRALSQAEIVDWAGCGGGGLGTNYCNAAANSTGAPASMGATGTASIAANDLTLVADGLPNFVFGFFVVSRTQGFVANPSGSFGNLCLAGAIGRYVGAGQISNSGGMGRIELGIDVNAIPQPNGFVGALSGETWNFQAWFRDSQGGTVGSNFTDGLELTFQ